MIKILSIIGYLIPGVILDVIFRIYVFHFPIPLFAHLIAIVLWPASLFLIGIGFSVTTTF